MDGQIYDLNKKRKEQGLPLLDKPIYVTYRVYDAKSGKYKQTTKRGFKNKKEAEKFLLNLHQSIENNTYVQASNMTVGEYLLEWYENYVKVNCKQQTIDGYYRNIRNHIIPGIGHLKLQKLTSMDIERFYRQKLEGGRLDGKGGLSAKSIMYFHRNLSEALKHARLKKLIPYNVADDVIPPRVKQFKGSVYDYPTILNILDKIKGYVVEVPFALAALAGLRRGEVLGLTWEHVDFEKKTLNICKTLERTSKGTNFSTPKSEESIRVIPMPEELYNVLKRQKLMQQVHKEKYGPEYKDNNLVCCYENGEFIKPPNISKLYHNRLRLCGFTPIRFHDLRHSYATYMIRLGIPLNVVSKLLGHKSVSVTADIYVHVVKEMKLDAIDAQNKIFEEFRKNKKVTLENDSSDSKLFPQLNADPLFSVTQYQ